LQPRARVVGISASNKPMAQMLAAVLSMMNPAKFSGWPPVTSSASCGRVRVEVSAQQCVRGNRAVSSQQLHLFVHVCQIATSL
jgi:hypothetical protein